MTVICATSFGVFLDEAHHCSLNGEDVATFEIDSPFMMEKQFENWLANKLPKTSRKRKLETENSFPRKFYFIENGRLSIIHEVRKCKLGLIRKVIPTNNVRAREAAKKYKSYANLLSDWRNNSCDSSNISVIAVDELSRSGQMLFHSIVVNPVSTWREISITSSKILKIPPRSSFMLSELETLLLLMLETKEGRNFLQDGFDLIVVDPPWPNKSVKRKRTYDYLELEDIRSGLCPLIRYFCRPNAIIAVWATPQNETIRDFILTKLFPLNSIQHIATWYWLKVTMSGEPICSLFEPTENHRKVPFEELYIGLFSPSGDTRPVVPVEDRLVVSIPSAIHSKKPYLLDALKSYMHTDQSDSLIPRCCELFARQLRENWFSWGREAILLNLVQREDQV